MAVETNNDTFGTGPLRIRVTPRTDDFVRIAQAPNGGFTRVDAGAPAGAADGFSRVTAPAPLSDGFQRAEPAPPQPIQPPLPVSPTSNMEGFTRALTTMELAGPPPPRPSAFDKFLEPITSYPATEAHMAAEARDQVFKGAKQLFAGEPEGERLAGAGNLAVGAISYPFAPINAALRTVVGKPVEENTGLPKEYAEFATGLALPIIGFGKAPKTLQKIFSPETVSQEAMEAAALIRQRTGIAARDTESTAAALESWQKPVSQLTPEQQLGIMHYIEGTSPTLKSAATLTPTKKVPSVEGEQQIFSITGKDGSIIGTARVRFDGDVATIDSINTEGGPNALGATAARALLTQFQKQYPEIKELRGERTTGARSKGSEYFSGEDVSIPLKPVDDRALTPQLRALADTLKDAFEARKARLQALPQHAQRDFLEDYFPHFWKDPSAAQNAVRSGAFHKQGSGASLKSRTIPTIQDGIAQGLVPLTTNPIEATLRYVTSMDKYIAAQEILNAGKDTGVIIYRRPTAMGASGHPDSVKGIPPGYVALQGRGSRDATGAIAYAPEDWARIYNNFISRGFEQFGPEYGKVYDVLRRGSNAVTQTLLSLSGYHAFTMAEAAMSSQMAKALKEMRGGHPVLAAKEFGKAVVSPITYAHKGRELRDVYFGKTMPVSAQDREIVDLVTQAGGRMGSAKHALDYESSALGDYLTAFRRGRLRMELAEQGKDIVAHPVSGTAKAVASNIGRIMDTTNKPLFQHYIPSVKNGAAHELLGQWLAKNPNATHAEKLAEARRVVDSVDNRFGEMIHDNIFWNKVAKQSAMLAMLSYSWNMGGWREIGGGVRDIARTTVGQGQWTSKADYVVGMTLNWAIMSAAYQYMKTGEAPKSVHDLAAPRTGGIDSRSGEPERILPPGIMKDVFGYYQHFGQEILHKINPGMKLAGYSASLLAGHGGSDWRGDPILSPKSHGQTALEKTPEWLAEYFRFITKTMTPIQVQNLSRGKEEGSNMRDFEKALGIRKSSRFMIDPDGYEQMLDRLWQRRWQRKQRNEMREEQRYGGTD